MPVFRTPSSRQWLLAAAGVAAVHAGTLYALWDGNAPSGSAGPDAAEQTAQAWIIPVTPVALATTPAPAPAKPVAAPRPATVPQAPTTEPPTATADRVEPAPPSAETATPATAEEVASAAATSPDPAPAEPVTQTTPLPNATVPPSTQWHFEVLGESKGLNYTAHATMDWRQDGQHYEARLEFKAFLIGSRVQTSSGTLGPDGLQPRQFTDRARKEKRLVFDHDAHLIRLDGSDATAPLAQGVQDRLSLFMQLSSLLAARAQAPAPGEQWSVWVAGSPAADTWTFRYIGNETLQLPAGRFEAWHLQRTPRYAKDQQFDLWFAPSLHFLPVRIRIQQDNGDMVDQQLSTSPG